MPVTSIQMRKITSFNVQINKLICNWCIEDHVISHGPCLIYRKLGDVSQFFATTTANVNVEESWIDSGFFVLLCFAFFTLFIEL